MATRRSYGTGSLVERPEGSGRWMFRYVAGVDPLTGKPRRMSRTIVAKNKTAAQAQARRILADVTTESLGTSAPMRQLLAEWMKFQSGRGRSPTTLAGYQSLIDLHVNPAIGDTTIGNLTTHQLDNLYSRCTRSGLSPRTVRNVHSVISAALNQAVRWSWVERNPALQATLPQARPLKIVAPTAEQARQLIAACQEMDEVLGAFVFLSAGTGCRRGEVAALRWSSVQNGLLLIDHSAYSIKGSTGLKSTKSGRERVVHLDPAVQQWLANWRRRCDVRASEWAVTLSTESFILSSRPDGSSIVSLDLISREVSKVAKGLGMGGIHLHSLRHFAATEMLAAGVSPRDTAEMLGHADPSLTLRVYAHSTAERQKAAAGVLAGIMLDRESSGSK